MTSAQERMQAVKAAAAQDRANAPFKDLSMEAAAYLARVFELSPGHSTPHQNGEDGLPICECPLPADCPPDNRGWLDHTCRQIEVLQLRVRADRIRNAQKYQRYTPSPGFRLEILHDLLVLMVSGHIGSRDAWEGIARDLGAEPEVIETALREMNGLEAPGPLRFPHGPKHPRMPGAPGTVCEGPTCGGKADVQMETLLAVFGSTWRAHVAVEDIYAVALDGRHRGRAIATIDGKATSEFGSAFAATAYDKLGEYPGPQKVNNAATLIRGQARRVQAETGGNPTALPVRATTYRDGYLIDLGDEQYVEVDPDGWRVTTWKPDYPVMLATSRPLPAPAPRGNEDLRMVHLGFTEDDPNWHQIRMWEATAFFADHERQLMMLTGGSGSGKTKRAQSIAAIVDPLAEDAHGRPVLGGPLPDDEALAPELLRNYLFTSDNLTDLDPEDSDRLCRIATGYRFTRRVLYTTADTYSVVVLRAGLLTGIDVPPQLREDAQNRLLHLELDATAAKRSSAELDDERRRYGPRMFGALLDDMVTVLRAYRAGQYDAHDRFPIVACAAQAFGPGYVASRDGHRVDLARNRAEADTMLQAVAKVVIYAGVGEHPTVRLTSQELFDAVLATLPDRDRPPKGWSPNPNSLTTRIGRNTATLAAFGISVQKDRSNTERWTVLTHVPGSQRVDLPPEPQTVSSFPRGPFMQEGSDMLHRVQERSRSRVAA